MLADTNAPLGHRDVLWSRSGMSEIRPMGWIWPAETYHLACSVVCGSPPSATHAAHAGSGPKQCMPCLEPIWYRLHTVRGLSVVYTACNTLTKPVLHAGSKAGLDWVHRLAACVRSSVYSQCGISIIRRAHSRPAPCATCPVGLEPTCTTCSMWGWSGAYITRSSHTWLVLCAGSRAGLDWAHTVAPHVGSSV